MTRSRLRPAHALLLVALLLLPCAACAWELRLTNDSYQQQYPAISGTKVVWQDNRNGNWDIYLHDLMTGETRRLTDAPADQINPQIAGHYVVWEDYRNSLTTQEENPDIYLLDLRTDNERMVNAPDSLWGGYEVRPAIAETVIDGEVVAVVVTWDESALGQSECGRIFFRYVDPSSGEFSSGPMQAYQDSNTQKGPWVTDQKVVWTDDDLGGVYFRYLLDPDTRILERMSNVTVTGIRASGDRIVWSQFQPEEGIMEFNIRVCELNLDLQNGTKYWLSPRESWQSDPAIDGDLVVWSELCAGGHDLYLYDFAADQERVLVNAGGDQTQTAIDGELVAFTDRRHGTNEIYLASARNTTPLPRAVVTIPGGGAPRDLNADGRYEDVNGNGRADFADVVLYFNQMSWIAGNEPVALFDYNANRRIDFADVVWLFNSL